MRPWVLVLSLSCLYSQSRGARHLRGGGKGAQEQEVRDQRSLVNTFPFNARGGNNKHQHQGHQEGPQGNSQFGQRQLFQDLNARDARQRNRNQNRGNNNNGGQAVKESPPSFDDVAGARPGNDGKRCIDKVEMTTVTEYDEEVKCDHSYDKRCHTTYVTNYESQQEEECEENFRKSCFIEYETVAYNETVEVCRTPLVKDCNIEGPELCTTQYESECWTKNEEHDVVDDVVECRTEVEEKCQPETSGYTTSSKCSKWPREVCSVSKKQVKKFTPITACTKEPREVCAPAGCGFTEGRPDCFDKTKTIVQDSPKEECSLEPQRTCKHVTKLVPKLEPKEECVDVPKEVCTRSKTNPRKVKKPVVKKWCYVPSEESGLA